MNKIVVTLVMMGNPTRERMHALGGKVTKALRQSLEEMRASGSLDVGELLVGDPGFAIVLTLPARMQENIKPRRRRSELPA
jgi:hypothetical protein